MLNQRAFTLLELVIGLVVLGAALALLSGVLLPLHQQSGSTWQQVRSAELAQGMLNEILARSFDENSPRSGGLLRCDEAGAASCAASISPCPASGSSSLTEEANRADWDDVDDYHCFRASAASLTDLYGQSLQERYSGYQLAVEVSYTGSALGFANDRLVKRIQLTVTDPSGQRLRYSALKGNW